MEEDNVLNPDDDVDIFCLHIVYLPLIQKLLEEFIKTWNLHGLSSLRGRPSPLRLFEMGLHVLRERSERLGTTYTELIQVNVHIDLFHHFSIHHYSRPE